MLMEATPEFHTVLQKCLPVVLWDQTDQFYFGRPISLPALSRVFFFNSVKGQNTPLQQVKLKIYHSSSTYLYLCAVAALKKCASSEALKQRTTR
jgi:hypothetical protein